MHIVSLKLLNFRNYDSLNLTFSPNNNIIYGKNGMGKTNLVEAIYVLSLTKSFRGSLDKVLIKEGKNLTKISGSVKENIKHDYQLVITDDGKTAKIDNNKIVKLSDYISKINVILFNPDDLKIIKDSPSVRRSNLNIDISTLNNDYLKILSNYNRVLKQRNSYLKTMYVNANTSIDYLNILTNKLVDYGLLIYEKRSKYFELINNEISNIYSRIQGIDNLYIQYKSFFEGKSKEQIIYNYKKDLQRDMLLGKTSNGVHHDDYIFNLDGKALKDFGSEGQQKNAIIAYKLAEISLFKKIKNDLPILILDDLFSELDHEKIDNILNLIDDEIQTFITTTDINYVSDNIKKKCIIFNCSENGVVKE